MHKAILLLTTAIAAVGCGASDPVHGDDAADQTVGGDDAGGDPTDPGPDGGGSTTEPDAPPATGNAIQTVFVIVMENHNWSQIAGSALAPYINHQILPTAAHAEAYGSLPGLHPSEPNYIWLESGATQGLNTDADPSASNSSPSTDHLVSELEAAGISWTSYQEDMPAGCPVRSSGLYAAKHNPNVFFRDVIEDNARCIAHNKPLTALQGDLDSGAIARYVFITPNLCNDMHGAGGCPSGDPITLGDTWLSHYIPAITGSPVYQAGHAAILITWDESIGGDHPIGMMAISPHAKPGYASTVPYSHSSTLRTLQEIFGVAPMLGGAANATNLADLFADYP